MSKASKEQIKIFRRFSSISEESQYTINFPIDVPQFYKQNCNDNGVLKPQHVTNSHQYNICHEFLLLSSVKPLRKILLKRSALF